MCAVTHGVEEGRRVPRRTADFDVGAKRRCGGRLIADGFLAGQIAQQYNWKHDDSEL